MRPPPPNDSPDDAHAPAPALVHAARSAALAARAARLRAESAALTRHARALRAEGDALCHMVARCLGPAVTPALAARVVRFRRAVGTLRADAAEVAQRVHALRS